jgi:hypothetical protein
MQITKTLLFIFASVATTQAGTVKATASSNQCLDLPSDIPEDGAAVQIYDCNFTEAQRWSTSNGRLLHTASGKCLDVKDYNTANGTPIQLLTCNGGDNQLFKFSGNTLQWTNTGKCVNIRGSDLSKGSTLSIVDCLRGDQAQAWSYSG